MRIIDRYVLRQFIQVFIVCWMSMTGLYVVFDAFTNIDEFLRHGGVFKTMLRYYSFRSVAFFDLISAVLAMIAAMFTMTWIQRHNELTALMAAGISRKRVVKPVVIAAAMVTLLALVNRELFIPGLRGELLKDARDLNGANVFPVTSQYDNQTGIMISGRHKTAQDLRVYQPSFVLPKTIDPQERSLNAVECFWKPANEQHPAGYLFNQVTAPQELLSGPALTLKGETVIYTPISDPQWLQPGQCFVVSATDFEQLSGGGTWWKHTSLPQMIHRAHRPNVFFNGTLRVTIHSRVVQPFLELTLVFLGLPLVMSRENRNMFVSIGLSVLLVVAFVSVSMACQYLGASGLIDAPLGAWLPLMIFVPLAVYMFDQVDR